MKKQTFTAKLEAGERGGAGIYIPFDVKEVFGNARAKVKVTIDKHTYRTTTAFMHGEYLIPVRKEIRDAIGKQPGDIVKIVMEPDTEERTVTVPDDFKKALSKNKKAAEIFDDFAFTHRKEYVNWIESAKKPETRTRRIEKAIEMISNKQKYS